MESDGLFDMLTLSVSLSATFLRNRILGALGSSSNPEVFKVSQTIAQNVVYSYPTIKQLSIHVAQLVSGANNAPVSAILAIEQMIEKYSIGLLDGQKPTSTPEGLAPAPVVLLTGSTGNLGSFMLEALLRNTDVERVYVYNRPARDAVTSQDRQRNAFLDKGFELQLLDSNKLVYLEGSSALPKLGLAKEAYEEVCFSTAMFDHSELMALLSCARL